MMPLCKMLLTLFQIYFIPNYISYQIKCKSFVLFIIVQKTMAFKDLVFNSFQMCGNIICRLIFLLSFLMYKSYNLLRVFENFMIYMLYRVCLLLTKKSLLLWCLFTCAKEKGSVKETVYLAFVKTKILQ